MIEIGEELTERQMHALVTSDSFATYVNAFGHSVDVFTLPHDSCDLLLMWCNEVLTADNNLSHVFDYSRVDGWEFIEFVLRNEWHLVG